MQALAVLSLRRTLSRAARHCAVALALGALCTSAAHAALALDPLLAGQYAAGNGVDARFVRIDGRWTGSAVYWKEGVNGAPGQYSNTPGEGFAPIGTYTWGTGIWGLADWTTINAPGSTLALQTWTGRVATIDQADAEYRAAGYTAWGPVGTLPAALFAGGTGPQDNWTSFYSGYLRITDIGAYNFGVLYDDGFFLRIWGADGSMVEVSSDFLSPRDRLGFAEDLLLGVGLYRFELGAYDRLQAGVVNLAWLGDDGEWHTVPTEHLVAEPLRVPTPGTAPLLLAGLAALSIARRRRPSA